MFCVSISNTILLVCPREKLGYFNFTSSFCKMYTKAYGVIILLRSIIHSCKSQDLNTPKRYQQYDNFKMNMYVKQLNSSDTNSTINMRHFLTASGIILASIHMLIMWLHAYGVGACCLIVCASSVCMRMQLFNYYVNKWEVKVSYIS